MSEQHSQHFNLSGEAKQKLEKLTARRYPGKQRRQSQLVEDLIARAFEKDFGTGKPAADGQEPERLASETHEAIALSREEAWSMQATCVTPELLIRGLLAQGDVGLLHMLTAMGVDLAALRGCLDRLLTAQMTREDGWRDAAQRYRPGQLVMGVINRITSFGAFARIEDGIEGLVRLPILNAREPGLSLHVGRRLQLRILHIDAERRHLGLGVEQADALAAQSAQASLLLCDEARVAVEGATVIAGRVRSPLVRPEHLFLSILQNRRIQDVFAPLLPLAELAEAQVLLGSGDTCPRCRRPTRAQWKHCVYCGQALRGVCPSCGTPQAEVEGALFCYACGGALL